MKGDVIIGLGVQCFDAERMVLFGRLSSESKVSNEVVIIVDSRKLPDLGTFQVGDSRLGRLYFSLQWYFCLC